MVVVMVFSGELVSQQNVFSLKLQIFDLSFINSDCFLSASVSCSKSSYNLPMAGHSSLLRQLQSQQNFFSFLWQIWWIFFVLKTDYFFLMIKPLTWDRWWSSFSCQDHFPVEDPCRASPRLDIGLSWHRIELGCTESPEQTMRSRFWWGVGELEWAWSVEDWYTLYSPARPDKTW